MTAAERRCCNARMACGVVGGPFLLGITRKARRKVGVRNRPIDGFSLSSCVDLKSTPGARWGGVEGFWIEPASCFSYKKH